MPPGSVFAPINGDEEQRPVPEDEEGRISKILVTRFPHLKFINEAADHTWGLGNQIAPWINVNLAIAHLYRTDMFRFIPGSRSYHQGAKAWDHATIKKLGDLHKLSQQLADYTYWTDPGARELLKTVHFSPEVLLIVRAGMGSSPSEKYAEIWEKWKFTLLDPSEENLEDFWKGSHFDDEVWLRDTFKPMPKMRGGVPNDFEKMDFSLLFNTRRTGWPNGLDWSIGPKYGHGGEDSGMDPEHKAQVQQQVPVSPEKTTAEETSQAFADRVQEWLRSLPSEQVTMMKREMEAWTSASEKRALDDIDEVMKMRPEWPKDLIPGTEPWNSLANIHALQKGYNRAFDQADEWLKSVKEGGPDPAPTTNPRDLTMELERVAHETKAMSNALSWAQWLAEPMARLRIAAKGYQEKMIANSLEPNHRKRKLVEFEEIDPDEDWEVDSADDDRKRFTDALNEVIGTKWRNDKYMDMVTRCLDTWNSMGKEDWLDEEAWTAKVKESGFRVKDKFYQLAYAYEFEVRDRMGMFKDGGEIEWFMIEDYRTVWSMK